MTRQPFTLFALTLVLTLGGCGKPPASADSSTSTANAKPAAPLLIAPQDLLDIQMTAMTLGPIITGSIQPQRRADLRAEVSSVVLQVLKDNGDAVRRGDLLLRLDDNALRESLLSADETARVAQQALDTAERQLQRLKTLREQGMASTQQIEDTESRRNSAQADVAAARTRATQARQQLQYTRVTAPFDGVVSDRKVSPGDTVMVGRELVKVLDPHSMRLEGLISADGLAAVKTGQAVHFRISGFSKQNFEGTVRRINPAANTTTRQIEVLVDFKGDQRPELAGLYAEGTVASSSQQAITIAANALVQEGDKAFAWRAKDGVLKKVALQLGPRDPRRGDYAVSTGLNAGDQVLRNPTSALKDGQKYQLANAAPQSAASAPVANGK